MQMLHFCCLKCKGGHVNFVCLSANPQILGLFHNRKPAIFEVYQRKSLIRKFVPVMINPQIPLVSQS
jgi:hypothetical protein